MNNKDEIKRITKLYESCSRCGLPLPNCICNKAPKVETKNKVWILSSEKELTRASNTARILKLSNSESTEIFVWERKNPPVKLIEKIEGGEYEVFLLFPVEKEVIVSEIASETKPKAFIIIDGTWKEAKKIYRKSEYLKTLPIINLKLEKKSTFTLRRGIEEGGLCTIETALQVLAMNGEEKKCREIEGFFQLFQTSYNCGRNGHGIDGETFIEK